MSTDILFERRLRNRLRATLDAEMGPDELWTESTAFDVVSNPARRRQRRVPWRLLSVAALLLLSGALAGALLLQRPSPQVTNGWVAYDLDGDIYVARDDAEPRRIVGGDEDGVNQTCAQFARDGHHLAYAEESAPDPDAEEFRTWTLVVVELLDEGDLGDELVRITYDLENTNTLSRCFEWAPDSEQLAFIPSWNRTASSPLRVATTDGRVRTVFDREGTDEYQFGSFAWSPDSSLLAVTAEARYFLDPWVTSELWLVDATSGEARLLLSRTRAAFWPFSWSADGSAVAFQIASVALVERDGLEIAGVVNVSLVTLDIDDLDDGSIEELDSWSNEVARNYWPVWSPVGDEIAYVRAGVIIVRDARLGISRSLGPIAYDGVANVNVLKLDWSPDGRRLLLVVSDGADDAARNAVISIDAYGIEAAQTVVPWGRAGETRTFGAFTWQGLSR